ncbi:hypothetical protein ACFT4A_25520 [Streptomyces sp. NPDC057099]|uniref:hypothetical protein n=1 Tax=Streptomyces sp. NPDC057099 TaxID=3346019 RepID=UPI00362D9F2A
MTTSFVRPEPPYYAVIITTRPSADLEGYAAMSERMAELGEAQPEHLQAQRLGRERWYSSYSVEVARVERAYAYGRD